jgi:hypothetical protein
MKQRLANQSAGLGVVTDAEAAQQRAANTARGAGDFTDAEAESLAKSVSEGDRNACEHFFHTAAVCDVATSQTRRIFYPQPISLSWWLKFHLQSRCKVRRMLCSLSKQSTKS